MREVDDRGLNWKVGGGHATRSETDFRTGLASWVLVVRLSDGVAWKLENSPGAFYGRPLYVTAEEVAMESGNFDDADADPNPAPADSRTIVRYPLRLHGAGTPP